MIAAKCGQLTLALQTQDSFDDAARLWAAVNIVTHRNNHVVGLRLHFVEETIEGTQATMDVANG
jgi:hypothetical protein